MQLLELLPLHAPSPFLVAAGCVAKLSFVGSLLNFTTKGKFVTGLTATFRCTGVVSFSTLVATFRRTGFVSRSTLVNPAGTLVNPTPAATLTTPTPAVTVITPRFAAILATSRFAALTTPRFAATLTTLRYNFSFTRNLEPN
ncbi:hypothetical protein SLA2020_072590 [Shorea laevis]